MNGWVDGKLIKVGGNWMTHFWRKPVWVFQGFWDWKGSSPSSRTMSLSRLLKQPSRGLRRKLIALEYSSHNSDLSPIENLCYDLQIAVHKRGRTTLKSWSSFVLKSEQKTQRLDEPNTGRQTQLATKYLLYTVFNCTILGLCIISSWKSELILEKHLKSSELKRE